MKNKIKNLILIAGFSLPNGFDEAMDALPDDKLSLNSMDISNNESGCQIMKVTLDLRLSRHIKGQINFIATP